MSFDSAVWAASILGCTPAEAVERLKSAEPDDPSIGPATLDMSSRHLRSRASKGDKDAKNTLREIDIAFAACDLARNTGQPCTHCH